VSLTPHALPAASLTALTEAAAAINSTLDLDAVLQTIARLACAVTRAEAASVFLLGDRRKRLVVVAATGGRRDALIGLDIDVQQGLAGHVVRTGEPINLVDACNHRRFSKQIDDISSLRTRTLIATPMVYRGEVIGVIEVVNRLDETGFDDHDQKILKVFAAMAAGATQNAKTYQDLQRRFDGLRESVMKRPTIIGQAPAFKRVLELCDKVSPSNATVLLLGETGTGKELTARYIHNASRRRAGTFVAINCAALPDTLLESELFGHEKGSFTGAHAQRRGWFELTDGGTLFLDEIGDITRSTQAKLLRVLQEKEFVRVGGSKTVSCDVRIIAATNRNLKNMMADGLFRDDLYYRLSVFPIELPALRDRSEDVPELVEHFVAAAVREFGMRDLRITNDTMDRLSRHSWPGNIRELQNVIERSVLMSDGTALYPSDLPQDIQAAVGAAEPCDDLSTLPGQERALILKALEEHGWNQSQAARSLGVSRYHLRHRIKKYAIEKPGGLRRPA